MKKTYRNQTIKNMVMEERPREKLIVNGVKTLTDAELFAIILGSGTHESNVLQLAHDIIGSYDNDLNRLMKSDIYELMRHKGIGYAKAVTIVAAIEFVLRGTSRNENFKQQVIKNSDDIFQTMKPLIGFIDHEEFWVIYLNRGLKIISKKMISQGGMFATVIDQKNIIRIGMGTVNASLGSPRELLKSAVLSNAAATMIFHNHPSGNPCPSKEDIELTKKMVEACKVFDIQVIDHVIICSNDFYSFADNNMVYSG